MDGELHFPHGQRSASGSEAYIPATTTQAYAYTTSTWPPLFPQNMSNTNGHDLQSQASSAGIADLQSSTSPSAPPPLLSPSYDMTQSILDAAYGPAMGTTSQPMDLQSIQPTMDGSMHPLPVTDMDNQLSPAHLQIRTSMSGADASLQQAFEASAVMMQTPFNFPMQEYDAQAFSHPNSLNYTSAYAMPLHNSPTEAYIGTNQVQMDLLVASGIDSMSTPASAMVYNDLTQMLENSWNQSMLASSAGMDATFTTAPMPMNSSERAFMGPASLSSNSDAHSSYVMVNGFHGRSSMDDYSDNSAAVSPSVVHVRADSHSSHLSDPPHSAASLSSAEELFGFSPEPELRQDANGPGGLAPMPVREYPFASDVQLEHPLPSPPLPSPHSSVPAASPARPVTAAQSPQESTTSSSTSPSAGNSPKAQRRVSPLVGVTPKTITKKKASASGSSKADKKIGRRRGPLRPEQREQAHEIRKLRACLRCRFLKKVCDKGNPCGGCQPAHARLWQVPCTRIDIKDIGYFFKDWNADYERHVTMAFSIANVKGFGTYERQLYITHGYGFIMPISAREVFVRDDSCFGADWVEQHATDEAREYEVKTHALSAGAEGISKATVSDYVDMHLDQGFEHFINEYFDGTPFLSELLHSIYRYYLATSQQDIRKGLRLVIAYALTMHITMVNGLSEEEAAVGRIENPTSRYFGQTCAPVMINFQVKTAMADLWRDLMSEVLTDLSSLYTAVYNGKKQKSWPTIFMLAALILSVWEMMQFDCNYRVPEEGAVQKFCDEMEHIPVGVVVGLFGAISTKLPGFQEWDAAKHGNVFNNDPAVCDTMTSVRSHIEKHEPYLRNRGEAKFCRDDFDSLSNKFLSKLVIRA